MTWKRIETMREMRLWIGQIVVPTVTLVAAAMAIPEVRETVASKAKEIKSKIDNKIKKDQG